MNTSKAQISSKSDFLIINDSLRGFYRTRYSQELLDGILEFYIKGKKGKSLSFVEINSIDIYGILLNKKLDWEIDEVIKILQDIKPIRDSPLLLKFAYDFFSNDYYYENIKAKGLEEFIEDQEKRENLLKENTEKTEELNKLFSEIVEDGDENKMKNFMERIFPDEEEFFKEEKEYDQLDNNYLLYHCFTGQNEDLIKFILDYYNQDEFINKNLRYPVYSIISKYASKYDNDKLRQYFDKMYQDFKKAIERVPYTNIYDFQGIYDFQNANADIIRDFLNRYFKESEPVNMFGSEIFTGNNKTIINILYELMTIMKKEFEQSKEEKTYSNMFKFLEDQKEKSNEDASKKCKRSNTMKHDYLSSIFKKVNQKIPGTSLSKKSKKGKKGLFSGGVLSELMESFNKAISEKKMKTPKAIKLCSELLELLFYDQREEIMDNLKKKLVSLLCKDYQNDLENGEDAQKGALDEYWDKVFS